MGKHDAKKSEPHLIILIIFIIIAVGVAGVVYFFYENKQREDNQVYFTLDSQKGDDYIIAVREAETTKAIDFYIVNIKTKEVKLQE